MSHQVNTFYWFSFPKILYESTSEESAGEDEEENKSGLLDLEDLGPMMNKMKKAKVKYKDKHLKEKKLRKIFIHCMSIIVKLRKHLNYFYKKIQQVQNNAARLIFKETKFCHITPLLKELHWLPINYRIQFKVLLITFKVLHGMTPSYLSNLISIKSSPKYNLGSNTALMMDIPKIRSYATLGDRSFIMAAPKLWNALPCAIRSVDKLDTFKRLLKTFF